MLEIEQQIILLAITYNSQVGEDLDDVNERLASVVGTSPGVIAARPFDDQPIAQLAVRLDHLLDNAWEVMAGDPQGTFRDLRTMLRQLISQAFERGVAVSLTTHDDGMPHATEQQERLISKVAVRLAAAGHVAYRHREAVRLTPQLQRLGSELAGLLDVVVGLVEVTDPDERARLHLGVIDQLVDVLVAPTE
jgi:hypothetical protein